MTSTYIPSTSRAPVKVMSTNDTSPPALKMGSVTLRVRNISKILDFYTSFGDLEIISNDSSSVSLGTGKTTLLILKEETDIHQPSENDAGLYHFAVLFSSRSALATAVAQILQQKPENFTGSADHLVSEAFYFTDPEGNGLELYFDRDPSVWQWTNDRHVVMDTSYIDPLAYIQQHSLTHISTREISIGHMHLKVGDIDQAENFYSHTLGLTVTARMPGALFLSDGQYHHHIGLNSWNSSGANFRKHTTGLESFQILVPSGTYISSLKKRLPAVSIIERNHVTSLLVADPWNNLIRFIETNP